jgi:hypothetical protein
VAFTRPPRPDHALVGLEAAPIGAAEHHVLEEMREAGVVGLVLRPTRTHIWNDTPGVLSSAAAIP